MEFSWIGVLQVSDQYRNSDLTADVTLLGVSIVGASYRSTMMYKFLERYPEQGKVVGIYDKIPARSRYLIDEFCLTDAIVCESLEQAVSSPDTQAVLVSTADSEHVGPVVAALKAGKHVFCEKPMAITLEDCDTIIEAAKCSKAVFYLGMNLRHNPVHAKLHEISSTGQLGQILTIESSEYYEGGRSYFRRWNRLRRSGGGLWIHKGCHDLDLLNWISGGKPIRAFATSGLSFYKPKPEAATHCRICAIKQQCPDYYNLDSPESPVQDSLLAITEKETGQPRDLCLYNSDKDTFDNGIAVIDYDKDVRATHTLSVVSARDTRQMRIMGTLASAEVDVEEGLISVWHRYGGRKVVHDVRELMDSGHGGADDRILLDFFRCCRTGNRPRSSWMEGRLSTQVGLAARQAADTGKPVDIGG